MYKDKKDRNAYQLKYYHNNEDVKEKQKERKMYYYWRNIYCKLIGETKESIDGMKLTTEVIKKECKKYRKLLTIN